MMPHIADYHAHVYYDAGTYDRARKVCEAVRDTFGIPMGHMHERPVGPHPMWSCQLTVPAGQFEAVISWLAINRDGLIVFVHPNTGHDLEDHRDHAIWMGGMPPLNLAMFE